MMYAVSILPIILLLAVCHHSLGADDFTEPELIEGDIILDESTAFALVGKTDTETHRRKRDVSQNTIKIWDDAVIPYVISDDMDKKGRRVIRKAMRNLARKTCVTFIPKQDKHTDYVRFVSGQKGCYSSIGRKGGEQLLSLGKGCLDRGHAIHEVMHTLGFFHEHSRFDRDKYIKVFWWNIQEGMERNFLSYSHYPADSLNEPYDLFSIMHYDNKAFSGNGQDTMQSIRDPGFRFGRFRSLSHVDIRQLKKLYSCTARTKSMKASCYNRRSRCYKYAANSDHCEASYDFMKIFCPKACAFC
ncbi:zinc metalloproteinase nas-4-like [Dendronephthya gigantea]|uniref:zinc metalloproteinase nas-4-like n=1 Tax=Dendronephthya gigantea TaxID=151771 RepID=UPI00106C1C06|nr:zinc metalloproteinase nas-4-like [Dendronephthya gigantea]XP_028402576.1 zinc metalloproteinase nas-4-like [Dendronephthya gigantea]XP_028402586.1 zinc metalloproteinase nas-4-like [Dendronephthya gigantea]XP_028402595.1 zinc metalloproteinase nas-4-like [Dendronephthya gigantea]XP_028402602.1 zinc metalloproteinase nas-4-like [Dendronephthya gigantea]XP_028402610.1 zinc metalloproteinase nas-4-like [Dendronephthya gigantea]XP_028402617.1 zinc metalloproteinase nas-4-like [Dendronephthya 